MNAIELKSVSKLYNKVDAGLLNRDLFWALSDVTFSVNKAETLGVIGPNGAGKSTLMRLISGVSSPTSGTINVSGRVVPLISIEGALQHILTGRENIFLLLAAFGIKRNSRKKLFDEIVEFAGISDHLDMQITKLSSGMCSRLSFSVAAHVPSEILLIDEILAVGDRDFQQKCLDKIREFKNEGKSMIFVSHDLDSIKTICDSAIWIDKGRILKNGAPEDIIGAYLENYAPGARP